MGYLYFYLLMYKYIFNENKKFYRDDGNIEHHF